MRRTAYLDHTCLTGCQKVIVRSPRHDPPPWLRVIRGDLEGNVFEETTMKLLASAAFGAASLATALIGSTAPAEARTSFGVYVGGPGYYRDYGYRDRCDSYWYRREHPRRCGYYYDYDNYYYPGAYYYDDYYPGFGFSYYSGGHRHGYGRHHWSGHHQGGHNWSHRHR